MADNLKASGIIKKLYMPNAFTLDAGGMYSLYGGLPEVLVEGMHVEFAYKQKEKDGKVYNNIIDGSLEWKHMPKDVSKNYSQEPGLSSLKALDKDTLIVRQSCLKAAIEYGNDLPKEDVIKLAEEFERWVFRSPHED